MLLHQGITDKIIKAFYKVYNALGYGFLEKVYENAILIELEPQFKRTIFMNDKKAHKQRVDRLID
jgi:GxxExxY protein